MRTILIGPLCAASLLAACDHSEPGHVQIGGEAFDLIVAADDSTRAKGLGGVADIDEHRGMIFAFPRPEEQGFWMVDCITDMDIAYVDPQGFVVATYTMVAEPPQRDGESTAAYHSRLRRYPSGKPAQFVIEVKAGTLERLGIGPGSKVTLDAAALKELAR